jgi:hypothetical protein
MVNTELLCEGSRKMRRRSGLRVHLVFTLKLLDAVKQTSVGHYSVLRN